MLHNRFRHQCYERSEVVSPFAELIVAPAPQQPADWDASAVDGVRARFHSLAFDAIYLVHGTFAGEDELGILRELHRVSPELARTLRQQRKDWFDHVAQNAGNYTDEFAGWLAQLTGPPGQQIPVRRFDWSGENHHTGRAEGAVLLLDELLSARERGERRWMLWGHSHAGNVFALITNLLSDESQPVDQFFQATRRFAARLAPDQQRIWQRVEHALQPKPLDSAMHLSFVTFGTPVRYGWESSGYDDLLHFIHHRPAPGLPADRAPFPFSWDDLRVARYGDYVQQLGIAGTNLMPYLFSWRNWMTERRLSVLLQGGSQRFLPPPFPQGIRVPEDGQTLLVDYPLDEQHLREQLFGHAVYTQPEFLLFHAQTIMDRWSVGRLAHRGRTPS